MNKVTVNERNEESHRKRNEMKKVIEKERNTDSHTKKGSEYSHRKGRK